MTSVYHTPIKANDRKFIPAMASDLKIQFTDNAAIEARREHYLEVVVDVSAILQSWRQSLFSHEWLTPDGQIKDWKALPATEQPKREKVELDIANGRAVAKPILGIGLLDNVEIGSGKAEFLTLAAKGLAQIPVHIPKSNEKDFKGFVCKMD